MDYIEKTLGLKITYKPWNHMGSMPYFITDRYEILGAVIGQIDVLMVTIKSEFPPVSTLQKHIARIQKAEPLPVVLKMETLSRYRRDALIKARIPFVVPEKQLYLPFLGTVLNERCDAEEKKIETLLPSAQVLLFYYLYSRKPSIRSQDAVKDLGYSAMSISRAARQMVQLGLFEERKEGVQKLLIARYDRKQLFRRIQPQLINPVKRTIYIPREKVPSQCKLAGFSAMAHYSLLNEPEVPCYAADVGMKLTGAATLADTQTQATVEIWKYDPAILSKGKWVDLLSLTAALGDNPDERTEAAIEELLEKYWEE